MEIIAHRRNTKSQLMNTKKNYGIEVDIRSYGEQLIIHHDPMVDGELFDDWLSVYDHGTLILNVKEEGLEDALISKMDSVGISNFFFLDQSFPFLIRSARTNENRCAVRFSEFESIDTAMSLAKKISWVWVDHFTKFPLNKIDFLRLKDSGFNICLVSPELQGFAPSEGIQALRKYLNESDMEPDAVCTKRPDLWE